MILRTYHVRPTCVGFLYRNQIRTRRLDPGVYRFVRGFATLDVVTLPLAARILTVVNQEVLSKDGVAFRASFTVEYRLSEPDVAIDTIDLSAGAHAGIDQIERRLHLIFQSRLRDVIAVMTSEEAFERRSEIAALNDTGTSDAANAFGVTVVAAQVRDLTFPKSIQDLFSRHLEAKIRAKADLENARTAVAAARALKNAAEIARGDETVRYLQYLELLEKVAAKGKHTFVIGDAGGNVGIPRP